MAAPNDQKNEEKRCFPGFEALQLIHLTLNILDFHA